MLIKKKIHIYTFMSRPLDEIINFMKNYPIPEVKTIFFHLVKYI